MHRQIEYRIWKMASLDRVYWSQLDHMIDKEAHPLALRIIRRHFQFRFHDRCLLIPFTADHLLTFDWSVITLSLSNYER
jgi:hypothetical protein